MAATNIPEYTLKEIRSSFDKFDHDHNGHITSAEIGTVFKMLGESVPGYKLREMIAEVDKDKNGTVEFNEFLEMYTSVTKNKGALAGLVTRVDKTENGAESTETASATPTSHSYSDAERVAFTDYINWKLKDDADLRGKLPIGNEEGALFQVIRDGILLCKLINVCGGDIDERAINKGKLNAFLVKENLTLALNSASALGCTITNIGPQDIIDGKEHLGLGLIWQIIRNGLFSGIFTANLVYLMFVLLEEGETAETLFTLSPEEILLRWVNYHLRNAGSEMRIANFSGDIKDTEAYSILLQRISSGEAMVVRSDRVLAISDLTKRADMLITEADKIGCRRFVTAKDIVEGNAKLNLAFVATLFQNLPAFDPNDVPQDFNDIDPEEFTETREEKTFRTWMNGLGVAPFVYHLYNDLKNGLVLFQIYDTVKPGIVDWDKVNRPPFKLAAGGNMKKIENCNYCVELAKALEFSVIGIGGEDIYNGTKTLTQAIVWQLMRSQVLSVLQKATKSDKPVEDQEIIEWANSKMTSAGKQRTVSSFKDPSLTPAVYADLIDAIRPGSIDYEIFSETSTDDDKINQARYVTSMARKIGARHYATPEDIVEIKPKMGLTIFAALMTRSLVTE